MNSVKGSPILAMSPQPASIDSGFASAFPALGAAGRGAGLASFFFDRRRLRRRDDLDLDFFPRLRRRADLDLDFFLLRLLRRRLPSLSSAIPEPAFMLSPSKTLVSAATLPSSL